MINIRNISKSYGDSAALKNIDFKVHEGELFGLIGPDGAGKTTLFRILTTLLIPDAGSASINGYDTVSDYKKIRREIGYMPGRFSLYPDLTVEENLTFFATVFNTSIEANYYLIEDIYAQIAPFKNRRAGNLSGGMKQKLALSCALIHKPVVLVLDEPTTGVDAVSRKEFWEMLQRLKAHGITIIVSTPYMDEAEMCDRIALIQNGECMQIASPDEIQKSFPKTLYALRTADKYRVLKKLEQDKNTYSALLFGDEIHYAARNDEQSVDRLRESLKYLLETDVELREIVPGTEDCFMELMSKKHAHATH